MTEPSGSNVDPAPPVPVSSKPAVPPPMPGTTITPLAFTIHIPDLRNGDISDIQQAAPKASIDSAYKWAAIAHLPPEKYVDAVEYVIRGTYAQIVSAMGASVTDAERTEARRKAIVTGGVRAGAAAAYRLTARDMNTSECSTSGYEYVPATGRIMPTNNSGTAGGKHTIAVGMPTLSNVEVEVIGMLAYLGMAVPVLQGASLVNTGHHYLPTTKNIFAGQKRQAVGLVKEAARNWVESMGESFDDMAFHKACHPISPPSKRLWAKDTDIAMRLQVSGHGASAIRLPAIPSDAAVGKTCVALANAAIPVVAMMGHHISVDDGPRLIRELEQSPEGVRERAAIQAIQDWAAAHASTFAFCAGIVQQVHESAGSGRNTLLSAYSVRKLMSEHLNNVNMGIMYSRAATSRMRAELDSGEFHDPNIRV